jgi:hypothetical protein
MYDRFFFEIESYWIAVGIFLALPLVNWLGFRYRKFLQTKHGKDKIDGAGGLEASMLGLMALMLGFTFSLALSKFEVRRQVIVDEANYIGRAVLCADLYPDSIRTLLRANFKDYIETRISYYKAGIDEKKNDSALARTISRARGLWKLAVDLEQKDRGRVSTYQMIPALNAMIEIVRTRDAGRKARVPPLIFVMLLMLTFLSSFLVGYGDKGMHRNWVMIGTFSLMTTIALYLIIDLDHPRSGFINIDSAEQHITDLRGMFNK